MMDIGKMLDENLEKRKEFYNVLKEINFDFDSQKVTMWQFKEKIDEMSFKLKRLCEKKLKDVKGFETKKQLRNIAKNADELNKSIQKINLNNIKSGKAITRAEVEKLNENLWHLRVAFKNASEARYRFLIKRSTLDYEGTREYFLKLSGKMLTCFEIYCALVSEINFSCLKNKLDTTDTGLINIQEIKKADGVLRLKNELFFVVCVNEKLVYTNLRSINLQTICDMLGLFRYLNDIRDFSKQIDYLKKIKRKMDAVKDKSRSTRSEYCDICGRNSHKSDFLVDCCTGHHWMCIDCLNEAMENDFKCPKCGFPLIKERAMTRIRGRAND